MMPSNFEIVSTMNVAFGNAEGNPADIDWARVRNQCKNVLDEWLELMKGLGVPDDDPNLQAITEAASKLNFYGVPDLHDVRDALCDIHVFAYGAHHFMGIDADRDMNSVVDGVMTRFIKNPEDEALSIARHAGKGVTDVVVEGEYPTKILRSNADQPDAPKGKFLKSASYREPVFYELPAAGAPKPGY